MKFILLEVEEFNSNLGCFSAMTLSLSFEPVVLSPGCSVGLPGELLKNTDVWASPHTN